MKQVAARALWFGLLCWASLSIGSACAEETLTPVEGRPPAADFSLQDTNGKLHRLADYRGRVLVVNFWATWCPPCVEEMPALQRAHQALLKDDIVVLGIDIGEDEDTVFTFTADYPVDFPLLLDRDSSVIGAWPIKGLPTTFVIDPEGRLVYRAIVGRAWDDEAMLERIRALRQLPAPPIRQ